MIQEMGRTIKHKAEKKNGNADALSRCPSSDTPSLEDCQEHAAQDTNSVNAVTVEFESIVAHMDPVLKLRTTDQDINMMLSYLTRGDLPDDYRQVQRVVAESKLFSKECCAEKTQCLLV